MQDATTKKEPPEFSIFISHAEEDAEIALELAEALRTGGYSTWCYEENGGTPGRSYLEEIDEAIDSSFAFLVVISRVSLVSEPVITEVQRAYEAHKYFLPIRYGISHAELQSERGNWRMIIGAAHTVEVLPDNVSTIVPKLLDSLEKLKSQNPSTVTAPRLKGFPPASVPTTKPIKIKREPVSQLLIKVLKNTPRWVRVALVLIAVILIYTAQARNFIIGECIIKEEDGGESGPFRDGSVVYLVDNNDITVNLRDKGYWAAPLESKIPLRGVKLNFELNKKRYPVRITLLSILLNRRQIVYLRPNQTPLFQPAPSLDIWGTLSFLNTAYAQQREGAPTRAAVPETEFGKVVALVSRILKVDAKTITPQTEIREGIARSRLVNSLQSEFGINIAGKDWERLESVGEIASYVKAKTRALLGMDKEILDALKSYNLTDGQRERLYLEPDIIPKSKLDNARKSVHLQSRERIFAMFDATVLGSGAQGFLFGDKGFYFSTSITSGPRFGFIGYEDFASRVFKAGEGWDQKYQVDLGNGQYFIVAGSRFNSKELANLLNFLAHVAKTRMLKNGAPPIALMKTERHFFGSYA
ncbi:MAG: eukaryotic-like serine/threonine-protein kinase [Acidobacteriota bacterium]|nr:eukaryotic-like serine/threonine-protein kinase [Acidobacteriota bacterium]